jgi:hypothetical protein
MWRSWGHAGRIRPAGHEVWPGVCVLCGMPGDLVIGDQVGPVPFRRGVLGAGDQECARLGELMGVPSGIECALAENQVDVAAFPHAQAYPDIHLGADRALSHGLLARPLGGGNQADRHGTAEPATESAYS